MNKTLSRWTATAAALLIIFLPGTLSARERRGANVVITMTDGRYVSGELVAVKPGSLLVLNFYGADESVELAAIREVRVIKKSKARLGAALGILAGCATTAVYSGLIDKSEGSGLSIILFLPAGGCIGSVAGCLAGKDMKLQLEGRSESEVRRDLDYLRTKARIRAK